MSELNSLRNNFNSYLSAGYQSLVDFKNNVANQASSATSKISDVATRNLKALQDGLSSALSNARALAAQAGNHTVLFGNTVSSLAKEAGTYCKDKVINGALGVAEFTCQHKKKVRLAAAGAVLATAAYTELASSLLKRLNLEKNPASKDFEPCRVRVPNQAEKAAQLFTPSNASVIFPPLAIGGLLYYAASIYPMLTELREIRRQNFSESLSTFGPNPILRGIGMISILFGLYNGHKVLD